MIETNPLEKFDVLTFQFEMLGIDEVARDLSSKMNTSIKQIYSAEGTLTEQQLKLANTYLDEIKQYPIHIVDNIGSCSEIKDTILYFVSENQLIEQNRGLVVTLDHSLLVRAEDGEREKEVLDHLMHSLIILKKYLSSIGCKVMFFILSQLNRDIESSERVTNPKLHYPTKNDIFGASSVYYSSDYVIIIHRPAIIEGIGNWYGPARGGKPGLPVFNPSNSSQPMIYLHVIKERFGNNKILAMLDDLTNAKIQDYVKVN